MKEKEAVYEQLELRGENTQKKIHELKTECEAAVKKQDILKLDSNCFYLKI